MIYFLLNKIPDEIPSNFQWYELRRRLPPRRSGLAGTRSEPRQQEIINYNLQKFIDATG